MMNPNTELSVLQVVAQFFLYAVKCFSYLVVSHTCIYDKASVRTEAAVHGKNTVGKAFFFPDVLEKS